MLDVIGVALSAISLALSAYFVFVLVKSKRS